MESRWDSDSREQRIHSGTAFVNVIFVAAVDAEHGGMMKRANFIFTRTFTRSVNKKVFSIGKEKQNFAKVSKTGKDFQNISW
jgi:hypothetical protein